MDLNERYVKIETRDFLSMQYLALAFHVICGEMLFECNIRIERICVEAVKMYTGIDSIFSHVFLCSDCKKSGFLQCF